MAINPNNGVLDIINGTLKVSSIDIKQAAGFTTALNTVARNDVLLFDDQKATTVFTPTSEGGYMSSTGVTRDTTEGAGYIDLNDGWVYWPLQLPNSWHTEFDMHVTTTGGVLTFSLFNTSEPNHTDYTNNDGGYKIVFDNTTNKLILYYEGSPHKLGDVNIRSPDWQHVNINYFQGAISVSLAGKVVLTHEFTQNYQEFNSRYVGFSATAGASHKIRHLRVHNSDKWLYTKTSNASDITYVSGNVGIGSLSPTELLDVHGNVHIARDLTVDGNLTVSGTTTFIDTANMSIEDPIIELARGNASDTLDAGLVITRATSNVAVAYRGDEGELAIGYTQSGASDADVVPVSDGGLDVRVYGNLFANNLTTTANVEATYFKGNGSELTHVTLDQVVGYGNVTSNTIQLAGLTATGNVEANYFVGDGSKLTGLVTDLQSVTDNGNVTSNTIQFTNATTAFVADSNVGIGTDTPAANLHVVGHQYVNDPPTIANAFDHSDAPLTLTHATPTSTTAIDDPKPVLHLTRDGTSGESYGSKASFKMSRYENSGTASRSRLDVALTDGTYTESTVMTLRADGRVGIGTTTPGYTLDVNGTANVGALTATSLSGDGSGLTSLNAGNIGSGTLHKDRLPTTLNNMTIENAGSATLTLHDSSGDNRAEVIYETTNYLWNTGVHGGDAGKFKISKDSFSTNDYLVIDTSGKVGIGTSSPAYKLDVHGTSNVGALTATSLSGDGSGLTSLNAENISSGTINSDRLSLIASDIPSLDATKITTGTLGRPISTTTGTFSGRVDSERYLTSNTFPLPDPNQHSFRHVCTITAPTIPYGLTQSGGCIYEYNPSTGDTVRVVEPVSEPTAGTFAATAGREYFPMGSPMTIVDTHKVVPFTNLGSLFGFIENRYDASTVYLYAPYSNVTVEYFHETSVTGTPTSTIVVPSKTVTTFTCTTLSGTNSHIFVVKGGKILMSSTGNGGDTRVLAPLSTIAYGYYSTSLANDIYLENNVTTSGKCVYSNQNVPLILSQAGDGDGGDGTCAIPIELVADTYIVPHDIRGWEIQFLYTETVVNVSYWSVTNSQWEQYGTYSPSGTPSILSPEELQVGKMSASGTDIGTTHTLWMFSGTKDFTLTVEEYTELERIVSGFRVHQVAQQIQTNLLDNVVQDSSGNVGIGTTSPQLELHVHDANNNSSGIIVSSTTDYARLYAAGGQFYIQSGTAASADSRADINFTSMYNTTNYMKIRGSDGNVGIGTSPGAKLDIFSSSTDPGAVPTLHVGDGVVDYGDYGMLQLTRHATSGGSKAHAAFIRNGNTVFGMGFHNNTNTFGFWPSFSTVTNTPTMSFTSGGNVGIGTASPVGVNGGQRLEGSSSTGFEYIATRDDTSTQVGDFIGAYLFKNGDFNADEPHYAGIAAKEPETFGNMDLHFYTGRDNYENDTPQMTIDYDGDVGIGTASPGFPLDVVFSGDSGIRSKSTNSHASLNLDSGSGYGYIRFQDSGSETVWLQSKPTGDVVIRPQGGSETVVFGANGNVGIGTTNPGYKLEVNGTSQFNSEMRWSLGTVSHAGYSTNKDWYIRSGVTTGKVILQDTGGNVGVGTNNPTAKLHVNGAIYAPGHPVQYVGQNVNDIVSYNSSTGRYITPLDITITPKFSNSKIMLHWVINSESHHDQVFRVYRGSTLIGYNTNSTGNWSGAAPVHYDADHNSTLNTQTVVWVDTPNTTSAVTYRIYTRPSNTGTNWFNLNRTVGGVVTGQNNHEIAVSYKSAMEIAV